MKTRIFVISLIVLVALALLPSQSFGAPTSQSDAEDVIQIVLVLDVSGSMGTPVYSGIVPEDLLSLLLRTQEIESDPDFVALNETLEAAKADPAIAAAERDWRNAFDEMSNYVAGAYGHSIPEVRNEVRVVLENAGCDGYMDQAIATAGTPAQIGFALNTVCPRGTVTTEFRQSIDDLVPYVEDAEYMTLRQMWSDAAMTYDDALNNAGFPSAQQQVDEFRAGVGLDNLQDEIDRLVEVYNIPNRLDLAKSAAINLIDLSLLDKVNTGRDSLIGLVAFTTNAFLEHGLTLDHEELKSIIQKWTPQEQTNIGEALTIGLNELGGADREQPMLVILLSDGHANVGMSSPEILAAIPPIANGMEATICTAGFADFEAEVDVILLDGLAEQTEGEYLFTNSGEELGSFFIACREAVSGKVVIGQFSGIVEAGDRRQVGSAEVQQNTCDLDVAMNFLNGSPRLHLTDPDGAMVDPTREGITYQRGDNVQLFSVHEPMAGDWAIDVSNDDPAGTPATFSLVVSTQPCEGPFVPVVEVAPVSDLPFLITEGGMSLVTILCASIVVLSGVGVFFLIRKRQKGLGKLIGGLFAALFVIVGLISLFATTIEAQALNPDFYLDFFESQDLYARVPEIAAEQLSYSMGAGDQSSTETISGPPGYFQVLTKSDWNLLLTGLLPADWLEGQVRSVVGQTFEYIDSGVGKPSISLSLQELKGRLSGEGGIHAIQQILEAQPDCSSDDLVDMTLILQGQGEPGKDFLGCNPPADFIEKNTGQFEVMLRRSLSDVPNEIDLADGLFGDSDLFGGSSLFGFETTSFVVLNFIRWIVNLTPLLSVFLLLLIAVFAAGSFRSLGGWWGVPLMIVGGIALAFALITSPIANWVIDTFIAGTTMTGFSPVLVGAGMDLIRELIGALFIRLRTVALIVFFVGLLLAILPRFFKVKTSGDQQYPPVEQESEVQIQETDLPGFDESTSEGESDSTSPTIRKED